MPATRRSTFWVVSTHVLTTGLAIPVLIGLVVAGIAGVAGLKAPFSDLTKLVIGLVTTLIGVGGGVLYSMAYLKRTAQHDRWSQCIKPSVIAYLLLAALGCAVACWTEGERTSAAIGIQILNTAIGMAIFAWLTVSGFQELSSASLAAAEAEELTSPATVSAPRRIHPRLRNSGIGFAIGLVVGVGIAVFGLDGGPKLDWEMILVVGPFIGGIGALLGLAAGPVEGV